MLQGAGGADPDEGAGTRLHHLLQRDDSGGATDAGAAHRNGLPPVATVDQTKLPVLAKHVTLIELAGDAVDPGRVAAQHHPLGDLVRAALQMGQQAHAITSCCGRLALTIHRRVPLAAMNSRIRYSRDMA